MAWQTVVDVVMHRGQTRHIFLSGTDGDNPVDLGEGQAPLFWRGGAELLFVRFDEATNAVAIVHHAIKTNSDSIQRTRGDVHPLDNSYDLTVGPDGSALILSTGTGRYGTAECHRLNPDGEWIFFDGNLHAWGGWSAGKLIYATDGRDLRSAGG